MRLKRFMFSCAILALLGAAVLYKNYFYLKVKPFYDRLQKNKRRSSYQLRNVEVMNSLIKGDLVAEKSHYSFTLSFEHDNVIHFQINDPIRTRYITEDVILPPEGKNHKISFEEDNENLIVKYTNFTIKIHTKIFEIDIYKCNNLILSINKEKYFWIEQKEPRVAISADFFFAGAIRAYGLPQRAERLSLKPTMEEPYRLYNSDRAGFSWQPWKPLYGAVPLLYGHGVNQTTGLLWLNPSETFVDLDYTPKGVLSKFFSESGALDFYVLSGPTLQDCVKQYAKLTGVAPLPPLFSLGYHQCRYSYMTQDEVIEVSDKFDENDLPLDAIWLDIDYADQKKYFTWNPKTFQNPKKLLKYLENKQRKVVAIVDPHVKADNSYFVYNQSKSGDFLVKRPNLKPYEGDCWPGKSSWIDYFNPEARKYTVNLYQSFAAATNLHIWNDMNEPAVFGTKDNTMPKDLIHYGNVKHRDVHNLYGFYQTMATSEALHKRANVRPFILTRSHFAGSQRFAAIWTGDSITDWCHLIISVPMCLTATLAGFSFCGSDVGGFMNHPTPELLQRWYQLGAWLPFFRGHSNNNVPRREPYLYSGEIFQRIRETLLERYRHLLYWYTVFWEHATMSELVLRPMIYQYPQDLKVLDLDSQFFVGGNIMVCPVTAAGQADVDVYLPGGKNSLWYYFDKGRSDQYNGTGYVKISVDLDAIPIFYKGGAIVPIVDKPVRSSVFIQDSSITLYVFCNQHGTSEGNLYIDDGISFDYKNGYYCYVKFVLQNSKIFPIQLNKNSKFNRPILLRSIKMFGFDFKPTATLENRILKVIVNRELSFVEICNINVDVTKNFVITLEKL